MRAMALPKRLDCSCSPRSIPIRAHSVSHSSVGARDTPASDYLLLHTLSTQTPNHACDGANPAAAGSLISLMNSRTSFSLRPDSVSRLASPLHSR
jgi:hypothetical protein